MPFPTRLQVYNLRRELGCPCHDARMFGIRRGWSWMLAGLLACGGSQPATQATGTQSGSSSSTGTTARGSGTTEGESTSLDASGDFTGFSTSSTTTGGEEIDWPNLECDPLVPTYCGFPFPNDVFTVADENSVTGRRLALSSTTMPPTLVGVQADPTPFNERDGFSPGGTILAHLPGATATGLPDPLHIADSLEDASPTILYDVTAGLRSPHFSEIDVRAPASEASLMLQPATSLEYGHRYIVGVRGLVDSDGNPVPASPSFAALRDGSESDEPSVESRRALYEDIFGHLGELGVERSELQLAWDFTVASREDTSDRLLTMRDIALQVEAPNYEITSIDEDVSADIFRRVRGEIEVPLFLDDPNTGGVLVLGDDGLPIQNGTARYPFTMMIPYSAQSEPAPAVLFGHGLFGNQTQVEAPDFGALANSANMIFIAIDWIGMSSEDPLGVAAIIQSGNLHNFSTLPDRLQQALVNFEMVARMMRTSIVEDPQLLFDGTSMLDPQTTLYYGGSQGGIMGASYMAIATEVRRGVLAVPGQPYNLLLERSVNFDQFATIIQSSYPQAFDQQMLLGLVQLLWDRAEPSGYSRHILNDTLPNTPSHEVLLLDSIGDHQVTTLGAHVMARSIGIPLLAPPVREVWGLETRQGPFVGSALVEYDFGLPPEPLVNLPMVEGDDPHGALTGVPAAAQMATRYLQTGEIVNDCEGPCDPG